MSVQVDKKIIGNGYPTYIVLEAGPTHTGLDSAKKLVDAASESGVDAIKFQMIDANRLMGETEVTFSYKVLTDRDKEIVEVVEEPLYDILKRRELSKAQWKELKHYCDKKKLSFICTAMYEDDVDFLVETLEVLSIKLASGDINHLPLIKYIARKGVNIQIDTGSSDIWEIERAVSLIEAEGNNNVIIHLCPTGYPARIESIHLRMLVTLKTIFSKYAVAFSDHSPGWEMDIAAIALGANLVEKTITLDRTTRGCEHMFSLEPREVKSFVESIRELEIALGEYRRTIPEELKNARLKARRSIFAKRDLNKGDVIREEDIDYRRPGYGISPEDRDHVVGKRLNKNIMKGVMIQFEDLCQ